VDEVRVAINETGRDPPSVAIDALVGGQTARQVGGGTDPRDATVFCSDGARLDGAETRPSSRKSQQAGVVPDAIAVHGAHMVQTPSLWVREALLPSGWAQRVRIRIDAGWIEAVERDVDPEPSDERHALAVAGLPNVHSHAFQRGMAGLAEYRGPQADDFWTWREAMYRFLDRLGPDDVEAIAAQAYVEIREAGYTRVGEFHYLHPRPAAVPPTSAVAERIGAAAAQAGIGSRCRRSLRSRRLAAPRRHGQRRSICDLDTTRGRRRRTAELRWPAGRIVGVAPHSLRGHTDELRQHSRSPRDPIHIHAAEQVREVEDSVAARGDVRSMAARARRRRSTLVPGACDAHDRDRNVAACRDGRRGRAVPDHGVKPRRWPLSRGGLPARGRALRHWHRFQRAYRRG
jgi:cytosine/adenosine deaminase-related metal-dependent hydrolase